LGAFDSPAKAVDTFRFAWIVTEYPDQRDAETVGIAPRFPLVAGRPVQTMAPLARLQDRLRVDLRLLVEDLPRMPPEMLRIERRTGVRFERPVRAVPEPVRRRIEARVPRLHFGRPGSHGFSPDPSDDLEKLLYYGLGVALSRGVLYRLARCDSCERPIVRRLDRDEESGRAFCDARCRSRFHDRNTPKEDRAADQRITRSKRRARRKSDAQFPGGKG
jgi:hypothetical protein